MTRSVLGGLSRAAKSVGSRGLNYSSPAHQYLGVFSDYSEPYLPLVKKHNAFFTTVSHSFDTALKQVDTKDLTSVRLTYQTHDKTEAAALTEKYIKDNNFTGQEVQEAHYIARFAGQATTRMVSFAHDPDGVHKIHKQFVKLSKNQENSDHSIPPLGRTMQNISNPAATAAKTRTAEDMKKTLGVDVGTEIKPAPNERAPDFIHHPGYGLQAVETDSEFKEIPSTGPKR